ncbi:hypothetical protein BC829DRAFT_17818 [Chytridium lagenaria]|nr:hypothetical protein BC829DRAFT_17818 [Chytridium lagenaria]
MDKSSTRDVHVAELSSRVLTMKFMQRGKDMEAKERAEDEKKKAALEAQWVLDIDMNEIVTRGIQAEEDQSYLSFMPTAPLGRKSFKGFNKEIESLSTTLSSERRLAEAEANEKKNSITDIEMAKKLNPKNREKRAVEGGEEGVAKVRKVKEDGAGRTAGRFQFLKPS